MLELLCKEDNLMAFSIHGGVFTDTSFTTMEPGTEETYGPFQTREEAVNVWRGKMGWNVDNCTHRLFIREDNQTASDWDEAMRGPRMSNVSGRTIFKYQMPVQEEFSMKLPAKAEIIRVADIDGMFWMWAVVDTDAALEERHFKAFKTGAPMPADRDLRFLGFCRIFVQMELGLYIFEDRGPFKRIEWLVGRANP